ncbi:MAG: dTDP-glucose 4,6-dehydratase [Pirellulaceae bacterium]
MGSAGCVIVTGGAGFIGSCLVRKLIRETDWRVCVVDKLTYAGNLDSLDKVAANERFRFAQVGIEDFARVSDLLKELNPVGIFNLAAESHVDRSIDGPAEFVSTNVVGTFQLLEAVRQWWSQQKEQARQSFRFVHVSTDEVYGSLGPQGQFTESSPYAPNSPYSASKASSDHFVRAYHHTYGLPVVTTNCSNNFGPCQFPEKLVPLMTLNAFERKPLPVYGDGSNVRDWLYVEDHCDALRMAFERGVPGEVYNVGGGTELSNLDMVKCLCSAVAETQLQADVGFATRLEELIAFVDDRPGHDQRYAVDFSKISSELGWEPKHTFEDALKETVRWYRENSDWVARVQDGSYQRERLGLEENSD